MMYGVHRCLFHLSRLLRGRAVVQDEIGNRVSLDAHDSLGLFETKAHESEERRLFWREVSRGSIVLDVGANIGYHTLLFSHLAGMEGKVFAFEPCPNNYRLLCRNLRENNCRNVVAENSAVSDVNGTMKLHLSDYNGGMNRAYRSVVTSRSVDVDVLRLDDYLRERTDRVDLIKVDVEGWEYHVMKGLCNYIGENRDVRVFTEFSPASMVEAGLDPASYLDLLLAQGFRIHRVGRNGVNAADLPELRAWTSQLAEITRRFLDAMDERKARVPPSRVTRELLKFAARNYNFHCEVAVDLFCSRTAA